MKEQERTDDIYNCPSDAVSRYRERSRAVRQLKNDIEHGDWRGHDGSLWKAVVLYQGFKFRTSGRGKDHKGAVGFTYKLKVSSRTGEVTDELVLSTREQGKTITRSSVELALSRYLEVQEERGCVKGPKSAGQIFGASYLYVVFLKFGVISSSDLSDLAQEYKEN